MKYHPRLHSCSGKICDQRYICINVHTDIDEKFVNNSMPPFNVQRPFFLFFFCHYYFPHKHINAISFIKIFFFWFQIISLCFYSKIYIFNTKILSKKKKILFLSQITLLFKASSLLSKKNSKPYTRFVWERGGRWKKKEARINFCRNYEETVSCKKQKKLIIFLQQQHQT